MQMTLIIMHFKKNEDKRRFLKYFIKLIDNLHFQKNRLKIAIPKAAKAYSKYLASEQLISHIPSGEVYSGKPLPIPILTVHILAV